MVNKKLIKTLSAVAVLLSLVAVPVFAKGNNNKNRMPVRQNQMEKKNNGTGMFMRNAKYIKAMGTIDSVDTKDSVVTIKDADGKNVKIHINPETFIAKAEENDRKEIGFLNTGDWIAVSSYGTETTTIEARRICVVPADSSKK